MVPGRCYPASINCKPSNTRNKSMVHTYTPEKGRSDKKWVGDVGPYLPHRDKRRPHRRPQCRRASAWPCCSSGASSPETASAKSWPSKTGTAFPSRQKKSQTPRRTQAAPAGTPCCPRKDSSSRLAYTHPSLSGFASPTSRISKACWWYVVRSAFPPQEVAEEGGVVVVRPRRQSANRRTGSCRPSCSSWWCTTTTTSYIYT